MKIYFDFNWIVLYEQELDVILQSELKGKGWERRGGKLRHEGLVRMMRNILDTSSKAEKYIKLIISIVQAKM